VLATGAANRELTVPGSGLEGIYGLRTLADAETVHARLNSASSVVVIGAGFVGLKLAAVARKRGLQVTVLEFADRPMGRALSPVMSRWWHKRPDCTKAGTSNNRSGSKGGPGGSPDPRACRPGSKVANGS
jgi:NADPH-dependent 2,4-dienoyl-CoA reductase/sulfur reductase-like enzyme